MAVVLASPAQAAIFAVNSTADTDDGACTTSSGGCTLREAINAANATASEDTINFDLGQSATTIALSSQLLTIAATGGPLTIDGENADITISGQGQVQVFQVSSEAQLTLANLTVANGTADEGGGINNSGTLTVTNSTFSNNSATNYRWGHLKCWHVNGDQFHLLLQLNQQSRPTKQLRRWHL